MNTVSETRIEKCNDMPINVQGDYVLYWMIANRRMGWNFSLQRAVEWAEDLKKPLVVFEALRCGCRWASDRLHRFVIDGMSDNAKHLKDSGVLYYPYLELVEDEGKRLVKTLGGRACVVVTDDFPCFFLPNMVQAAASQLPVLLEKVDSNGILPMVWADKVFSRAFDFRRFLQNNLEAHLNSFPDPDPIRAASFPPMRLLPESLTERWPSSLDFVDKPEKINLGSLPLDHNVPPSPIQGGQRAAHERLHLFLSELLPRYADFHNHPDNDVTSGLSPYLHFGHISVHQVFEELMDLEGWSPDRLSSLARGSREGWWGVGKSAEAFLDQLITWRELGYNMCRHRSDYDRYESLPDWANLTLETHEKDPRPHLYSPAQFENARTHDELWNACQTQLVLEGRMHNYLRMLWGKKILEWSRSPMEALEIMIELNNKYALDGRNPNSYSGIFWILGRYDRAWGPERPIFGKVRYMSSRNTKRKLRLKEYLKRYTAGKSVNKS
jgi:deoxyribodipyrimidine photo-lyase